MDAIILCFIAFIIIVILDELKRKDKKYYKDKFKTSNKTYGSFYSKQKPDYTDAVNLETGEVKSQKAQRAASYAYWQKEQQAASSNQNHKTQQAATNQTPKNTQFQNHKTQQAASSNQKKQQAATTRQEKIQKGRRYEVQIGNYFSDLGYFIERTGLYMGKRDGGIDIICNNKNKYEILLIQCKNWVNPPKQKDLKVFLYDCRNFVESRNLQGDINHIRFLFITSCPQMDKGAEHFIKENPKLEYIQIDDFS